MDNTLKVWSEFRTGTDGNLYGLRYLLSDEEARHMQKVGLLGDLIEIAGMQQAADQAVAMLEKDFMIANGGNTQ